MTARESQDAQRDIGLQAVAFLRERLQIDDEWLEPRDRGFRWWAGPLAQTVEAEPVLANAASPICRVRIRTDLLRGFRGNSKQEAGLRALMTHASLSGPVRDPADPGRLGLASCLWVGSSSRSIVFQLAAWTALIQAAEAHLMAPQLPGLLGGVADASEHPGSGAREEPDEMLDVLEELVRPRGDDPSDFAGPEMLSVLESLRCASRVEASGSDDGLTAEFALPGKRSLLELSADAENPRMGSGLLARLAIPGSEDSVEAALAMNEREIGPSPRAPRSHFVGSWAPGERGLTFVSFVPNAVYRPGLLEELAASLRLRANWLAGA